MASPTRKPSLVLSPGGKDVDFVAFPAGGPALPFPLSPSSVHLSYRFVCLSVRMSTAVTALETFFMVCP